MTMTESWWLKYERAQQHRREAEAMIADVLTDPAPTITVSKAFSNGSWEFSMHPDAEIPEMLPVVIGDYLRAPLSSRPHRYLKSQDIDPCSVSGGWWERQMIAIKFHVMRRDYLTGRMSAEDLQPLTAPARASVRYVLGYARRLFD
jgi:hypothetical protein